MCLRPSALEGAASRLVGLFPGDVLYAVKCNPHPEVLRALYRGGVRHFDTASLREIRLIRSLFGADAEAYFNHPVKARDAIREAYGTHGVRHFIVDSEPELEKLAAVVDGDAVISVRLATPPGLAIQHMSSKFGAAPAEAARLLQQVAARGFPTGIAFHVGSQCRDPNDFAAAVRLSAQVRDAADVELANLNVGGGLPAPYLGDDVPDADEYVAAIASAVESSGFGGCALQCEPGRALVVDGCSILTQVHLRKDHTLHINDGIFGSLCELVYLKLRVPMRTYRRGGAPVPGPLADFTLYGPTCDPVDVMPGVWALPEGIQEGDWIEVGQIGAYSSAMTTTFNGFTTDTFADVDEAPFWLGREEPQRLRRSA